MNARSYCRLTRPVLTGLIVVFYTFFGWKTLCSLELPVPVSWFLALAVVAPWLCGGLLAGGLHEFMHQTFFGVLPGARRSLRRWHCGVLGGVTAVLAALSWRLVPGMPVLSTIGVSAAVMALPLLNRRAPHSTSRFLWIAGCVLLVCGMLYVSCGRLYAACLAAPWAVFPGGLLIAVGCFRIGFDRLRVRARAGRPFRAELNSIRGLFKKDGRALMAMVVAEQQGHDSSVGRDWLESSIDGSDRAWLRVLLHERYGQRARAAVWFSSGAFMFGCTAGVLGFSLLLARLVDPAAGVVSLCTPIVTFGRTGFFSGRSPVVGVLCSLYVVPVWVGLVMTLEARTMFRVIYPVSRHRLAWLNFLLSWRWSGIRIAFEACILVAMVGFAALLAAIPPRLENLRVPVALMLVQLPLIPLFHAVTLARRRFLGLIGFGLLNILFLALAISVAWRLEAIVSWPAAAGSLTATAFGTWIYWRLLLRRYSTSDLNQPIGMIAGPPSR